MGSWKQYWYVIQNPQKYVTKGKTKIFYKSSLEQRFMWFCDNNQKVLAWGYEVVKIPYFKPVFSGTKFSHPEIHQYVLDFYVEILENDNSIGKYLIEVKSKSETSPPKKPTRMTSKNQQRYNAACQTYIINHNKWKAAEVFCESHGLKFKMMLDTKIN